MLSAVQKLRIIILSSIWPAAMVHLQAHHSTRIAIGATAAELPALLQEAEVAVLRSGARLDRPALEAAPSLRLIVRAGAGMEGIDCECARERGVRVIAVPLSALSVAEHSLGLALALSHQIVRHHAALVAGRWEKHANYGRDLYGRQLGLLGFGRIGQRTAELGRAFGMSVVSFDRSPNRPSKQSSAERLGVRFVTLEELLTVADILTIQTPLNEDTRWLMDAKRIASMKPTALLINVGRGCIVDELALYLALLEGRLAGAALDVFECEPPVGSPLFSLPNFIGTPHSAAQTQDAQEQVGRSVIHIIDLYASGGGWETQGVLVV